MLYAIKAEGKERLLPLDQMATSRPNVFR